MIAAHAHLGDDTQGWLTLTNRHSGEHLRMRRIVHDGAMCLELKSTLPPRRDGPPLHIHLAENEEGTVVAGTLGAEVDGRQLQFEAGSPVRLPKGSVHRWWNAGDDTLVLGRYRGTEWPSGPARCAPAPVAHGPEGVQERRRTAECA